MVDWIRARLSFKFWMAEEDISLEIFLDTAYTTVPKTPKISMMDRSRAVPLLRIFLSAFSFMGGLHFIGSGAGPGPLGRWAISVRQAASSYTILLYSIPFGCQ